MREIIERNLEPGLFHIEVANESGRHSVPRGVESHFKVILVSEAFNGIGLLARHRTINRLRADESARPLHAPATHACVVKQSVDRMRKAPLSSRCLGGNADAAQDYC